MTAETGLSTLTFAPAFRRASLVLATLAALAGCTDEQFGMAPSQPTTASQALGDLKLQLRDNPTDAGVLKRIGELQAQLSAWPESMGAYREALIVAPGDREALLGFGNAQLALGDYQGALRSAQQAGGEDVDVLILRSGAMTGLGQLAQARQTLNQAQAIAPRDLDVRNNIALVAALSGDPTAYAMSRAVAFAPDATARHILNLPVVGGITGNETQARADAGRLGVGAEEIGDLIAVGRRARLQGLSALSVLARQ